MVGCIGRREPFGGAGDEIRYHGIDGCAVAGDKYTGLPGGSEIGLYAARIKFSLDGKRGVHLADRGIRADRQQTLAWPFLAGAQGKVASRVANVEQRCAPFLSLVAQHRDVAKAHVQATGQIHAPVKRRTERLEPIVGNNTASVGYPHHQGPCARLGRFGN